MGRFDRRRLTRGPILTHGRMGDRRGGENGDRENGARPGQAGTNGTGNKRDRQQTGGNGGETGGKRGQADLHADRG